MKVILKEEVKDLGQIGEMLSVKDGYARNFLIPRGLAVEANPKNIKSLEHEKRKIQEIVKKAKAGAEDLASKLSAQSVTIKVKAGEEDKLFGSVTAMDITEALKKEGLDIDRKRLVLDEPIKRLGTYKVTVRIHPEVSAQISVNVEREG
ncbi:MAG: 50S ribosomal protein L9 [Nitrospirae bacterium]|nr:50S ribosomal protein L9 [Nitrospirota bacterium]